MDWFTPDCSFKAQRVFVQKDVLLWGQSLGAWGTGEAQRGPAAWEHSFLEGRNKTRLGLASHGEKQDGCLWWRREEMLCESRHSWLQPNSRHNNVQLCNYFPLSKDIIKTGTLQHNHKHLRTKSVISVCDTSCHVYDRLISLLHSTTSSKVLPNVPLYNYFPLC